MKFGKEFKKQMVPEWTDAYMDYNGLKRLLKEIRLFKQSKEHRALPRGAHRRLSLYSPFHGLTHEPHHLPKHGDVEDQAIDVKTIQKEGSQKVYKTDFLHKSDEGGEREVTFFGKLDKELNKVNSFYKNKMREVIDEAASLDKQMDALIALRIRVQNPNSNSSSLMSHHSSRTILSGRDRTSREGYVPKRCEVKSPDSYKQEEPSHTWGKEHMNSTSVIDMHRESQQEEFIDIIPTADPGYKSNGSCSTVPTKSVSKDHHLQILDRVRINNTFESPMSTIKGVIRDSKDEELSFGKDELRRAEQQLRLAFIEFYQKLRHLKYYSYANLSAFAKIMKKYEKISNRGASRSYMKIVDNSFVGSCDKVSGLIERVEINFIKHFTKSNRREGMKSLRPKVKRERHSITFFSGFFSGCLIALLIAVVLNIEARKLLDKVEGALYMANIFPLYSFYVYLVLHLLMYAADIYFWKRYRVNYSFIFGFKQGTELGYREVFLIGTGLGALALGGFLTNLYLDMSSTTMQYKTFTKMVPLGLATVVFAIMFCPLNIVFRSSRFFLIRCIRRCIFAPLYKVTLPDFFLADNLTSQVQAIRIFTLYICYYGMREFSQKQNKCLSHDLYNMFYYIVAVVPYWLRCMQCFRRLIEEKEAVHAYNGLKYLLTIIAVIIRTAFELKKGTNWMVLALISSAVATLMNTYWDIVVDWGLLRWDSKNYFLRDKLVISHKIVYFIAMILNIILRISWMQLVLEFNLRYMHKMAALVIVSCLEIIRRGIWNFFRLENEHLNNVGKYRAFKSVPLPFNYYEEKDEEEEEDKEEKDR